MDVANANTVSDDYIYTGAWVNWARGPIKGSTITLTHRNGSLLTAFLALYVALVGRSFWRLFCFTLHSFFSNGLSPQDGLYHQRQVILRNTGSDVDGLQYFVRLIWAWRNRSVRPWRRVLPLLGLTILTTTAFYAASILSSQASFFKLVYPSKCLTRQSCNA